MYETKNSITLSIIVERHTLIIIYRMLNNEIKIEGNTKLYFNLRVYIRDCRILLYMKVFMDSVLGRVDRILNMFS